MTVDCGNIVIVPDTTSGQVVAEQPAILIIDQQDTGTLIAQSIPGPRGAPGLPGVSGGLSAPAGAAIGGHRIVFIDSDGKAYYASNQNPDHGLVMLGLTINAAILDEDLQIVREGDVTEISWSWILDTPIWLADNGLLTQTVPVPPAVFSRIVAFPITATRAFFSFREPLYLI